MTSGLRTTGRLVMIATTAMLAMGVAAAYPISMKGSAWFTAKWEHPWMLAGLTVVPFVFWRATFGEDARVPRLRVGTVSPLARGPVGGRVWLRDVPGVLRAVALAFLVTSMARPVSSVQPDTTEEEGIDAVVVLDLSGSMEAVIENLPPDIAELAPPKQRGLRPTRLDAAKAVIRDFISRRKTDRIGVVVFGKAAYVLSPPTLDYHLLDALVSRMELNLIDGGATAIGDALGVAVARLRRSHAASKAIVLLTDGDNNAGRVAPEYSAHLASVVGAKVYTIQIGSGEMSQALDGFDLFGQPHYVTKSYPTNPELLRKIAQQTGGRTYVATDARALQASLHDVLNQLEKTKFESTVATFEDLYRYLLLPGVLLVAIEAFLRSFVLRRFP
jgi:Ca-activated chloride channel family protein